MAKKRKRGLPKMITQEQYFAGYPDHRGIKVEHRSAAAELLVLVNEALARSGVPVRVNPHTESRVSGQTNGGWRPQDCPVGAQYSAHKLGKGIDIYDPYRELATWCANNLQLLEVIGLWMEDFRWTPTWVHFQSYGPNSGRRVFIPSNTRPLAAPVDGQEV